MSMVEVVPKLVPPTARLHRSWCEARAEWPEGAHMAGSGVSLFPGFDLASPAEFAAWTKRLIRQSEPSQVSDKLVPTTFWWIIEHDRYVGAIDLRHSLNAFLAEAGGHIGYSVRPSSRGRGLATWALREVLRHAGDRGIHPVLVTCDEDNVASIKTIERNGGHLESIRDTEVGRKRRYWVTQ